MLLSHAAALISPCSVCDDCSLCNSLLDMPLIDQFLESISAVCLKLSLTFVVPQFIVDIDNCGPSGAPCGAHTRILNRLVLCVLNFGWLQANNKLQKLAECKVILQLEFLKNSDVS